jgi:phosphatidylserine/phosphatidylglycerophosphate/cardiolipin synthase-like enzyme
VLREQFILATALLLIFSILPFSLSAHDLALNNTPAHVYFSPDGGCTEAIVKEIDKAITEILVQAYSFTSAPIAKVLATAKKRGVSVEVVLDKSQKSEKYTSATFLTSAKIPTCIDSAHAIAHNKIIIDKQTMVTGSFNFIKVAEEKKAENPLVIKNKELTLLYIDNWLAHKKHSEPYQARY